MSAALTTARTRNLQKAQRVRLARAAHRREVAGMRREKGEATLAALLADPPAWLRNAPLEQVLAWPHDRGPNWARAVVRRVGLASTVRVGDLSEPDLFRVLPQMVCGPVPWTRERLIRFVQVRARELGRTPTRVEFEPLLRTRRHPGSSPLRVHFGGYTNLTDAAGLPRAVVGCLARREMVPTSVLRQAFAESARSARDVAHVMGWTRRSRGHGRRPPDAMHVQRTLGLKPESGGKFRRHVSYEMAVRLLRAMDVAPREVGL